MTKHLILAGAALAFAAATPALAKPDHAKGHGKHGGHSQPYGSQQARGCPPGLAKKGNGCQAPGQAKKRLSVGSRYLSDYAYRRYSYNQLPESVRDRYFDDRPSFYDDYNYYYDDGTIYRVDPTTQVVEQIIRALIR